jgi:hypothetical protein
MGRDVEIRGLGWTEEDACQAAINDYDSLQDGRCQDDREHECDAFCGVPCSRMCEDCAEEEKFRAEFVNNIWLCWQFYYPHTLWTQVKLPLPPVVRLCNELVKGNFRVSLFDGLRQRLKWDGAFCAEAVTSFGGSREQLCWCLRCLKE